MYQNSMLYCQFMRRFGSLLKPESISYRKLLVLDVDLASSSLGFLFLGLLKRAGIDWFAGRKCRKTGLWSGTASYGDPGGLGWIERRLWKTNGRLSWKASEMVPYGCTVYMRGIAIPELGHERCRYGGDRVHSNFLTPAHAGILVGRAVWSIDLDGLRNA